MVASHRLTPENIATYQRAAQKRAMREIARNAKPVAAYSFAPIAWTVYAVVVGITLAALFAVI